MRYDIFKPHLLYSWKWVLIFSISEICTVRSWSDLRYVEYWCSHRIQFPRSVSFPHCKSVLTKSKYLDGNQCRDRGMSSRIIWLPPILGILIGRIWCHRITMASEQRRIERAIPNISIIMSNARSYCANLLSKRYRRCGLKDRRASARQSYG